MAKFCVNCGASLAETAKFCNGCGTRQDDEPLVQRPQYQQPPVQQPATPTEQIQQPQPQQPQQQFQPQPQYQQPAAQPQPQYQQPAVQPQPQYQQPPMQQPGQQLTQQAPQEKPKKKRRIPLLVKIVGIAAFIIVVGIVVAVTVLNNAGKADYFKFGKDQIPSVKLALGEERNMTGASTSAAAGGGQLKVFTYQVDGTGQNDDMFSYLTYLREKDGFLLLTGFDFNGAEGSCVVGRNSVDAGYEIQLQIEYDRNGYVISILKQKGEITPNAQDGGNQTPGQTGNAGGDMSNSPSPEPSGGGASDTGSNATPEPSSGADGTDSSPSTEPGGGADGTDGSPSPEPGSGADGTDSNPSPEPGSGADGTDNTGTPAIGSLTKDMFDIMNSGAYHMKLIYIMDEDEYLSEVFVKNGMTSEYMDIGGMEMRFIEKDGKVYTIVYDYEMVFVEDATPDDNIGLNIDPDNMVYIGEGSGDFRGRTYKFDEYRGDDGDQIFFYMEGGALKGIRTISGGETYDKEILALDRNVPDDAFDIPDDFVILEE